MGEEIFDESRENGLEFLKGGSFGHFDGLGSYSKGSNQKLDVRFVDQKTFGGGAQGRSQIWGSGVDAAAFKLGRMRFATSIITSRFLWGGILSRNDNKVQQR